MSKKLTSIVISAGLLLGIYITGENATAATTSSVTLSRITATFQPSEFATHCTAPASDNAKHALTYKWTFLAFLLAAQQQQYGGVQYEVRGNGLAIQVK